MRAAGGALILLVKNRQCSQTGVKHLLCAKQVPGEKQTLPSGSIVRKVSGTKQGHPQEQ